MDFWSQLAWPDSTEVNSFTEVSFKHIYDSLMLSKGQFHQSQQVVNDSGRVQPPNCGTLHVHARAHWQNAYKSHCSSGYLTQLFILFLICIVAVAASQREELHAPSTPPDWRASIKYFVWDTWFWSCITNVYWCAARYILLSIGSTVFHLYVIIILWFYTLYMCNPLFIFIHGHFVLA